MSIDLRENFCKYSKRVKAFNRRDPFNFDVFFGSQKLRIGDASPKLPRLTEKIAVNRARPTYLLSILSNVDSFHFTQTTTARHPV